MKTYMDQENHVAAETGDTGTGTVKFLQQPGGATIRLYDDAPERVPPFGSKEMV